MSKFEFLAAALAIMTSGATAITLIVSWFSYREKKLKTLPRPADPLQEQRLARIESAVEAIALEVERISEGQRFTTRLLAERHGAFGAVSAGEPASVQLQHREGRAHAT